MPSSAHSHDAMLLIATPSTVTTQPSTWPGKKSLSVSHCDALERLWVSLHLTVFSCSLFGTSAVNRRGRNRDQSMQNKLKCLAHYFTRISETSGYRHTIRSLCDWPVDPLFIFIPAVPTGCITYKRKVITGPDAARWSSSTEPISSCRFSSTSLIEDADGMAQVRLSCRAWCEHTANRRCRKWERGVLHQRTVLYRINCIPVQGWSRVLKDAHVRSDRTQSWCFSLRCMCCWEWIYVTAQQQITSHVHIHCDPFWSQPIWILSTGRLCQL